MATRHSSWMWLLATLVATGAHASADGEFRLGAQASSASWRMAYESTGRDVDPAAGSVQPDADVSWGIVGQYVFRFDVGDLRGFGGIEVSTGTDSNVAVQGPVPDIVFAHIFPHPGTYLDGEFHSLGMSTTRVDDAVCIVGVNLGKVAVFGGAGVSRVGGKARFTRWAYDYNKGQLNTADHYVEHSHWGIRSDIGIEFGVVESVILQVRATHKDYRRRTYSRAPHSLVASLEATEYVATLLYRF